jgi:3-hydroxyacyl-[acyl-carrier-protein] dehydratase
MQEGAPEPGTRLGDIDVKGIMRMIPHRFPMLLVDRVENVIADRSATGIKCITANEPYFQGHFPTNPIMPGVLIVEAMAQSAAVLVIATLGPTALGSKVYFMSVEQARFRRPVVPGDRLMLHIRKLRSRMQVWKCEAQAMVGEQLVAEAVFSAKVTKEA